MYKLGQIVGIFAVAAYVLSYQLKKRNNIVLVITISNVLYVLQYVLLGAFEGAAVDCLSAFASIVAYNKNRKFISKHTMLVATVINLAIFVSGMALYRNIVSLCSIAGALLQTSACWLSNEKKLRIVSFLGTPFWLVYNLTNKAYGSSIGTVLSMISLGIAIYRYDIKPKQISKDISKV